MKTDDKDIKLDSFHYHEVLDRLWVINDTIDRALQVHPVVQQNLEVARLLTMAQSCLSDAYQEVGNLGNKQPQ